MVGEKSKKHKGQAVVINNEEAMSRLMLDKKEFDRIRKELMAHKCRNEEGTKCEILQAQEKAKDLDIDNWTIV
jgi:hypothetical protein